MPWTTMPETAIHKNRQTFPLKGKVRPANDILVPAPASDFVHAQQFCQHQFSIFVATGPNPRHYF